MTPVRSAILAATLYAVSGAAYADTFDFEVDASFLRSDTSFVSNNVAIQLTPPFIPLPTFTAVNELDADLTALSGTWFFSGVNINEGPRNRAAFLSRASSLSIELGRLDTSFRSRVDFEDPALPDQDSRSSGSSDVVALSGRYVWQDTGWYGLAGVASSEAIGGGNSESYRLGIGRYVGERTSIDFNAQYGDFLDDSVTTFTFNLSHVGDLTGRWQYGADVSLSQADSAQSDLVMDGAISLFPTRSLAFGVEYVTSLEDIGDGASYDAFLSWFANETLEVSARLGTTDQDTFAGADEDRWGLGFRVRF